MAFAQFWPVGSSTEGTLSLTQADICRYLLADWLPDLPVSLSQSVIGWPQYLIEAETGTTNPYLFLNRIAGWSDRQWKSVLSWMIGVACTRRVLDYEGYSHIAPCSAFYPERKQLVSIPSWLPAYPPSILEITKNPPNKSRLRPDYIAAIFQTPNNYEFAFVESKGTSESLRSKNSCPADWRDQARNAKAYVNGVQETISRNLVVASRCNPNAKRKNARRLQIRAWNSQSDDHSSNNRMLVEIALAHYVAILRNLGLVENIKALAISRSVRIETQSATRRELAEANERADSELLQVLKWDSSSRDDARHIFHSEDTLIKVQIARPVLSLIKGFRSEISIADFDSMIGSHLAAIEEWYLHQIEQHPNFEQISVDRSGFLVINETRERR